MSVISNEGGRRLQRQYSIPGIINQHDVKSVSLVSCLKTRPKIGRSWVQTSSLKSRGFQHAARGPPDTFVQPVNNSKNNKIINFEQIQLICKAFILKCGPQKLFTRKLRPGDISSWEMRNFDRFEFETLLYSMQINSQYANDNVCFAELDQDSKMIIFDYFLTTFKTSLIFRDCWGRLARA